MYSDLRRRLTADETVADTDLSGYIVRFCRIGFYLPAERCHANADVLGCVAVGKSPDFFYYLIVCYYFSAVFCKIYQKLIFKRSKVYFFAVELYDMTFSINYKTVEMHD